MQIAAGLVTRKQSRSPLGAPCSARHTGSIRQPVIAAPHRGWAPRINHQKFATNSSFDSLCPWMRALSRPCGNSAGWLGIARWSSSIKFSSVWIAGMNSCSPQGNSFSFTTSSSGTIRSGASYAKQSVRREDQRCAQKPAPPVRSAAKRQRFRSNQRKGARCFAANAFSVSGLFRLRPTSRQPLCNA